MERCLRLRQESDFRRLRAEGRSWGSPLLTLLVVPNGLPHNRYGVIVSKRVGNAVTRNRIKRRLRDIVRRLDHARRIPPGHDLAFIVRPALATASFAEARQTTLNVLTRAKLLAPATPSAVVADGGEDDRG